LSQGAKLSRRIAGGERRVAWPDRREERNLMSIAPEQLEETAVETEPSEDATQASEEELVVEDLLVEDVSIDGMCGVY
jgi:mycofactocin precursor